MTGGLPRVPIPIPMTAAPNQIRDAIDNDRETRTKWPASRSVRYGWRRRTTPDIWLTPRGMPGTSWVTMAIANSATTRREDQHQVAMDRPWVPEVVDQDHDEDQDERRLQSDVDGVHESLGTARAATAASIEPFSRREAPTADVNRFGK